MFIAALFTIAKPWRQPKCSSTDEWIKKMWYNRRREQTYGHQAGKVAGGTGGGGGMNWEIGIDIYTLICIKYVTNKNLLYKK